MALYTIKLTRTVREENTQEAEATVQASSSEKAINGLKKLMAKDQDQVTWKTVSSQVKPSRPRIKYEVVEGESEEEGEEEVNAPIEERTEVLEEDIREG